MTLLSLTEGELCNILSLKTLQKADFPVNRARLAMMTAKEGCPRRELNCRHMSDDICGIDQAATEHKIRLLAGMRSVELTPDGAIRRIRETYGCQ